MTENSLYMELLSKEYPTANHTVAQILQNAELAACPKPTELYISDVHGEYETFTHIVRNVCGSVKEHIDDAFGEYMTDSEKSQLATLIYYPEQKLRLLARTAEDEFRFYFETAANLITVLYNIASEATFSSVKELAPKPFGDLVADMLNCNEKQLGAIIQSAIRINAANKFIYALAHTIQNACVSKVHLVGDVYDRGPSPDKIMEELAANPALDIQWGNHDVVWMGAALGQRGCIAHVVRNCARYGNLNILTEGYGIDILPLATFARTAYKDDPCVAFGLKSNPGLSDEELDLNIKIQKAMAIIQFKVEAQLIDENPSFGLENRKLLHTIDWESNTIEIDGTVYKLTDTLFPTVDRENPYKLTDGEEAAMEALVKAFQSSEKLQRHMQVFLDKGSLYKIENNTLMFHACVPLNPDGSLKEANLFGKKLKGKALFDAVDKYVRDAFTATDETSKKRGLDLLWYLWLGDASPLFAKSKMATFELYLIAEKEARKEVKNSFYSLYNDHEVIAGIFRDFGMEPSSARIVCGHTPIKVKDGEDPVKCDGQVVVIDGGMSSAYRKTTGIGGFTLVSNAEGVKLATHQSFAGMEAAIKKNAELVSEFRTIEKAEGLQVSDTDQGKKLAAHSAELLQLLKLQK